jgi:hypothetical protein
VATTVYAHIRDVRAAGSVPNAPPGAAAVCRFSAVGIDSSTGAVIGYDGGQQNVTDVVAVAINAGDTLAAIQNRITALLQGSSYYGGSASVVYV